MFFSSLTLNQTVLPFDSGANWELAFIWYTAFVEKKKKQDLAFESTNAMPKYTTQSYLIRCKTLSYLASKTSLNCIVNKWKVNEPNEKKILKTKSRSFVQHSKQRKRQ